MNSRALPLLGTPIAQVDTPALVIDVEAMQRNLAGMAAYAREHRMRLRPHAKMHKSATIAKMQIEAGAAGVCVQKLSEAEVLAELGVGDIFISNEIIDPAKLERLAVLAGRIRLAIAVDSVLGVERLANALKAHGAHADVFVEIDVGQGRCGVAPTAAGQLAHQVVSHGLHFAGLQAYHGKAQHMRSAVEREAALRHTVALVRAAQAGITRAGIACPLVTGAGTGTFVHETASGLYAELQCGSYLFMDRDYADNEPTPHAPRLITCDLTNSACSKRGASHAVVDAGHKAHAIDSGLPRVWQRELDFANGGDEHGILRPRGGKPGAAALPELGETVWLVPGHCDPTVNLHDHYIVVRGGLADGVVEAIWPVDTRGCLT